MRKVLLLAVVAFAAATGCAHNNANCCPPDAKDCEHAADKSCSCPEGACPHAKGAPATPAAPVAPAAEVPAAPAAAPAAPVTP